MIAASVSKCRNNLRIAMALNHYYSSNCHKPYSFSTQRGITTYPFANCIKSIPVGALWILPFFQALVNSRGNCRSVATKASPRDLSNEILNEILSQVDDSTVSPDKLCATYIDKLCSSGDLPAASMLMQSLQNKSIFPGLDAYSCLLKAAAEQNDLDILSQSFKDLLTTCESISSTPFLILAEALVKKNSDVFLIKFLREISDLTFPRNTTFLNRIIFAFVEFREVDKVLTIFDQMKVLKCTPDLVTYNTILAILGRCGRVDDLLHKFASMKESNVGPDTISYNTLINSLRKVGRLDLCKEFFKEMGKGRAEPDLRTYTALIDSFGRSGDVEEALRLFEEMKHRRIRPSIYVYRSLISNLKKMGKFKLATKFSEEMDASLPDLVGPRDFKRKKR